MDSFLTAARQAWHLLAGFDPEVWRVAFTSLRIASLAAALGAVAGAPLGMAIAVSKFRGRDALLVALNTSMAMPTVVIGLFVYALIGRRGPLGPLGLLFTPSGIVLGEFLLAVPIAASYALNAVEALDPRLFQTIRSLGTSRWHEAWMIVREARFGMAAALVGAFGRTIAEVGVAMMLGGNIRGFTRTMTTAIALETSKGEFELGLALGGFLLLLALLVNLGLYALQREAR
ncbi:MAG TPA: ABC transporter permease [Anaeromyxobacteraceae bacterium]|nr:ABC transporter permease [Anaeromyxobacteraceae bacterium]